MINNNEIFCSVVMPVHNGERFLHEAIESVLKQSYTNFEFLIIENCSSDASVEIIKSYSDSRIRLIYEKNCGQVQAYNRGFKEAKGEYIFIHDHDDISENNRFSYQLEYSISNNIDILGSNFSVINSDNNLLYKRVCPEFNNEISKNLYFKINSLYNPTVCIRKTVFEKYGVFDLNVFPSSDYDFFLRVQGEVKCGNIQDFLYNWRSLPSSMSHKNPEDGKFNAFRISLDYLHKRKSEFSPKEFISIKTKIYYYYDFLGKALILATRGIIKYPSLPNLKIFVKIIVLFVPITILGRDRVFNSSIALRLRKIFALNEFN